MQMEFQCRCFSVLQAFPLNALTHQEQETISEAVLGALGDDDESAPPADYPIVGEDETCSICGRPPEDQCDSDSGDDDEDAPSDDPFVINPILLPGNGPILINDGPNWLNPFFLMAPRAGLEPATWWLTATRSTN